MNILVKYINFEKFLKFIGVIDANIIINVIFINNYLFIKYKLFIK